MDRRHSLKVMALVAAGSEQLLDAAAASAQDTGFSSRWHEWPDVRWAGPEYWGNRLQDWEIVEGRVVCRTQAPNRTLHCLTHTVTGPDFRTSVGVHPGVGGADSIVGIRLGVKGRLPDVRSAAVHGTGLDVGLTGSGRLVIGDAPSDVSVLPGEGVRLEIVVVPRGESADVALRAREPNGGRVLGTFERVMPADTLVGNCALLSHFQSNRRVAGARFTDWRIAGSGVAVDPSATYGPIMFTQYTLHRGTLKLTAQLAPVEAIPGVRCYLEARSPSGWRSLDSASVDWLSRTARFRVDGWSATERTEVRVRVAIPLRSGSANYSFTGSIAAEPAPRDPVKAAVFSCNADHGFPDTEVVEHVAAHQPDVALFLGDQFYEGSGGFGIQTDTVEEAALDMLHKWYMFGWSYREIFRHIPAACIPDDHDVYHGNIWGEGGKHAPSEEGWGAVAQDQGGYKMRPEWVNAVQTAQTSHLPDPYDGSPAAQGIGVYYTGWEYGGVSFAILEDRKFKSAPGHVLPAEAEVFNGWIQNPDFDVREHRNPPNADLLGDRQMEFLRAWAEDWSGAAQMKVVLSQTNFAAVHTIPEDAMSGAVLPSLPMPEPGSYVDGDKVAVDMDSNGWPAARRDDVLRILRSCAAFHIAGDQHLATVVRHGIDDFGDAGFSFTGPALNNIWPRRWWPPRGDRLAPLPGGGPEYTGDFLDGFGNRITVHASANPRETGLEPAILRNRVTGYGIVTFDKEAERIIVECWPRHVDPRRPGARQYEGWPLSIRLESGDGREPQGFLPRVRTHGIEHPVVEVRSESGALVSTRRLKGSECRLPVFEMTPHVVRVGDPDRGLWLERKATVVDTSDEFLDFDFGD